MATFDFCYAHLNPRLHQLFTLLEEDRKKLLSALKEATPDVLSYAPEGKWSIHEILAHLVAAERLTFLYVSKKMLGVEQTRDTGLWEELKMLALKLSQRMPFKFKAPRVVVEHTLKYDSWEQLSADWQASREELRALLEKFNDRQIRKKIYRHVRAGRMNIQHALLFLREHMVHHAPQIKALLDRRR